MSNDKISKALDIEHIEEMEIIDDIELPDTDDEDHDYARSNFYSVIQNGKGAIKDLAKFAKDSESTKAYEALAVLMKTVIDANKDLVDINEKRRKSKADMKKLEQPVTNNNLFVGSTKELQQMLKDKRKDDE